MQLKEEATMANEALVGPWKAISRALQLLLTLSSAEAFLEVLYDCPNCCQWLDGAISSCWAAWEEHREDDLGKSLGTSQPWRQTASGFHGREGFYGACRSEQLGALLQGLWAHLGRHWLCLMASCPGIVR